MSRVMCSANSTRRSSIKRPRATQDGHPVDRLPGREGRARGRHGGVDVVGTGQREVGEGLLGRRVDERERAVVDADPLAGDEGAVVSALSSSAHLQNGADAGAGAQVGDGVVDLGERTDPW